MMKDVNKNNGVKKTTKRRNILIVFVLSFMLSPAFSQMDTTLQLISKVDFQEQYELHDGNLIHLMGFTQLISAPLNIPAPTLVF